VRGAPGWGWAEAEEKRVDTDVTAPMDVLSPIDEYGRAWNEKNSMRRRELLRRCLSEDCEVVAPVGLLKGREAVDAEIAAWHKAQPGHTALFSSAIDSHHGWARFAFAVLDDAGREVARGTDVAQFATDGRLRRVVTFFDADEP
jgi:hypothetical protein